MNVQTMAMDPRIARVHYGDYMVRCRKHREERKTKLNEEAKRTGKELRRIQIEKSRIEKEDRQLLLAYKALMKGQRLIHLPNVIRDGGFTKQWLPKLAITRADATQCVFYAGRQPRFEARPWTNGSPSPITINTPMLPGEVLDSDWRTRNSHPNQATAIVPTVPPNLRPDDLSQYHILWEAEWTFKAPEDPILLSRVNDTMYAVVAQWDLTPLEMRILESR